MTGLALEQISYRILLDAEAVVESCTNSITTLLARNSVPFRGSCIRVAHLRTYSSAKTFLVPYSIRTIFPSHIFSPVRLESIVFEFGSKLEMIHPLAFSEWQLNKFFLPESIRSIGESAFSRCRSLFCVHFSCYSSVWQLRSMIFSRCGSLTAVTIPAAVRQIHNSAFEGCKSLLSVTFQLPSQCWYITSAAFENCPLLKPILLPPSVEVIDPTLSSIVPTSILWSMDHSHVARWSAAESSHFCVENDCLVSSNGRRLNQYEGLSSTFSISEKITVLSA
jgi:hypothetical protein